MSNKLIKPQKPQSNDIFIDDGSKVYTIKNKRGKVIGEFEFRPSDTNIVKRYEEVVDYLNNFKMPEDTEEAFLAAENEIKVKMSYLIGGDAGEAFFSILGPFSALASGELFVENVLGAISKVIEKEMSVRTKKVQRRMNKYVAKYHK